MNNATLVVPPKRARIMGPLTLMSGGISIACGGFIALQPGEPLILGVTLVLLGLMFSCGGIMLWGMRGGVVVAQDKLILGGQSTNDCIKIRTAEIQQVIAHEIEYQWGEETHAGWVCEVISADAPRCLLGESDDEHGLKHFAHKLTSSLGIAAPVYGMPKQLENTVVASDNKPQGVEQTGREINFEVGAGGTLHYTLLSGGLSMLIVGGLLIKGIAENNVFGFLFGPTLLGIGILLTAIPMIKRNLVEEIRFEAGPVLIHNYLAHGVRYWRKQISLNRDTYVRVRQRGLRGASLEVVSEGHVLHMAGSVHSGCKLEPQGLMWLGYALQVAINNAVLNDAGTTPQRSPELAHPPEASTSEPAPDAPPANESPD